MPGAGFPGAVLPHFTENLEVVSGYLLPNRFTTECIGFFAHGVPFNTVAGTVCVTTGRQLRENGMPQGADSVFVMLDGACSFSQLSAPDLHIWWGAFLGMENQILMAGPLQDVATKIVEMRAQARAAHGWIMDTYLLRRSAGESNAPGRPA